MKRNYKNLQIIKIIIQMKMFKKIKFKKKNKIKTKIYTRMPLKKKYKLF